MPACELCSSWLAQDDIGSSQHPGGGETEDGVPQNDFWRGPRRQMVTKSDNKTFIIKLKLGCGEEIKVINIKPSSLKPLINA